MQQARYSREQRRGTSGSPQPRVYCHFTSPIRRYPDLVVHRQLRAERNAQPDPAGKDPETLFAVGATSSELERNSEVAERELLLWKKLAFIKDKVGENFEGVVTGVARFGLFVQLVDNLVEGLVRVELLGHEWFLFDEGRMTLTGSATGRTYRLGRRLAVTVDRVDRVRQRVDFSPAETETDSPRRTPARQTGRAAGRRKGDRRPAARPGRRRSRPA